MSDINYDYIEDYIRSLIPKKTKHLLEMKNYALENNVPIVEEETEEFLKFLISVKKPKSILELGTAIGYSSIVFVNSFKGIEKFDTVEIREDMVEIARKNIKLEGLENTIKVLHGDAAEVLETLTDSYDIIFIDAAKGQYEKYFNLALKNLNSEGIIICDNVLFKGMIANQELVKRRKITIVKRLRSFLKRIKEDEIYISSIIPIGDGILLIGRNVNL
ncbi:Predicted O-methyltransferase YrrM [Anaerosphaera aminiphila DSM 21120]|uniref:tRNA 5-hydroxyuridine methyltransferase n=1 Tax=Anaerosphaera aminiphila DSM 21120 TaxID=1120995 RepID=A0A1M5NNQ0_9FIRM|nr:O-methyltransferase [Anaerosphaera aminiphila]SHG91204.1 Predicted O-methyltransferase YrrM [Anaerosphaera aminiphila DSM 21120]